jgi:hypothetical protein
MLLRNQLVVAYRKLAVVAAAYPEGYALFDIKCILFVLHVLLTLNYAKAYLRLFVVAKNQIDYHELICATFKDFHI